ncbi:Uncharacterized protein TCAP_05114 [Tolypocladium capitatum]|uniref:Lea domain-containing protein n=1 Tax=Tolypocladium capitatum TaxID=45235 RepID=A0A2K3QBN8_9HYPO|nr:Uncharacterized protein TCAP_05114 [Tolypocladium capitatum]
MSFVSEKFIRLAVPVSRALTVQAPRALTTSAVVRKSASETVKDGLKSVDRAISDNVIIPGLDAATKVKEGAEKVAKRQAAGKAERLKGKAECAEQAKGTAEQAKNKL